MAKYVLAIDCGTGSLRAIIFDKHGNTMGSAKITYDEPYFSLKHGYAEQYAEYYYDTLCKAVNVLKCDYPMEFAGVEAVCVTSQRDTMILLGEDGVPLRPAVLWVDKRENNATLRDNFTLFERLKYKLVGMDGASGQVMNECKAYWFRENEPENWQSAKHVIFLGCYLTYRLTGVLADSVANQIGHLPFDSHTFSFPENENHINYRQFGIPKQKLYPLVSSSEELGRVTEKASRETGIATGTVVVASGSDKGCETVGNGALEENVASISFGTTATVEVTTKKYIEVLKYIPPYPSVLKGYYNPEYEVYRGYWLVNWFKDEFAKSEVKKANENGVAPEEFLDKKLPSIPPGSDGLMLQPFWTPGITMHGAKGTIIGFNDSHTLYHVYRSIIEGINYAMMEGIERIERSTKVKIDKVIISGGGSQSDEVCAITADMLGVDVYRAQTHETSSLGASMSGFVHIGEYADYFEAAKHMVHYTTVFKPVKKNTRIYRELYKNVYKKLYPALKDIYIKSHDLVKGQ